MNVTVKRVTDKSLMDKACEFTSGKPRSSTTNYQLYLSEHSPIRTQLFWVEMHGIPTYVSVHFTRHKIGVEHFVQSNRNKEADRNTPVNHAMFINAAALINMARKRLCNNADDNTRLLMEDIKLAVLRIDEDLALCMLPECRYRGTCPEPFPCYKGDK